MITKTTVSNKTYIKAIKTLQLFFAQKYNNGGWLPGGREMANKLEISHSTYRKALTRLEEEGFVKSYPCKGHYVVPNEKRCHKIGIILRDGSDSPFLEQCESFIAALQILNKAGFEIQFIQSTRPEQLHDNAIAHGVDGLIWFRPSSNSAPHIHELHSSGDIPLVIVKWREEEDMNLCECCVSKDYQSLAKAQVKAITERGHSRILLAGYPWESWTRHTLTYLHTAGVKVEFFASNALDENGTFHRLLHDFKPNAIISCSGETTLTTVFTSLSALPEKNRPELLLSESEEYKRLQLQNTGVKFMVIEEECQLGEAAATALISHIKSQAPLRNVMIGASKEGLRFYPPAE